MSTMNAAHTQYHTDAMVKGWALFWVRPSGVEQIVSRVFETRDDCAHWAGELMDEPVYRIREIPRLVNEFHASHEAWIV